MGNLVWLAEERMERLRPFPPGSHGQPPVDGRHVLRGMIFMNRNGLWWCDAPRGHGLRKTLYDRWSRREGARIMEGRASDGGQEKVGMVDATCLKAHRTASSLRVQKTDPTTGAGARSDPRRVDRTRGCTPSRTPGAGPWASS